MKIAYLILTVVAVLMTLVTAAELSFWWCGTFIIWSLVCFCAFITTPFRRRPNEINPR